MNKANIYIFFAALLFLIYGESIAASNFISNATANCIIEKGDSLLYNREIKNARLTYQKAYPHAHTKIDSFYLDYKIAHSYRIERNNTTAFKLYSRLHNKAFLNNCQDTAFGLLIHLETLLFKEKIKLTENDLDNLEAETKKHTEKYNIWEQTRIDYCFSKLHLKILNMSECLKRTKKIISSKHTDPYTYDRATTDLIYCYKLQKDTPRVLEQGYHILNKNKGFLDTSHVLKTLAYNFVLIKEYDKAINLYHNRLEYLLKQNKKSQLTGVYVEIANYYVLTGQDSTALNYYNEAYRITKQDTVSTEYKLLALRGLLYYHEITGQLDKARPILYEILHFLKTEPVPNNAELNTWINLILNLRKLGEYERIIEASEYYMNNNNIPPEESLYKYNRIIMHNALAYYRLWEKDSINSNQLLKSYIGFKENVVLGNNIFNSMQSKSTRHKYIQPMKDFYNNAIISGMDVYNEFDSAVVLKEIYEYVEDSKALMFRHNLKNAQAISSAGISVELGILESKLKGEIEYLRKSISDYSPEDLEFGEGKIVISRLNSLIQQHDSLKETFSKEYSKYFEIVNNTQKEGLEDAQNKLSPDQVLLNYYIGERRLMVFVVTKETVEFAELPVPKNFQDTLISYREMLKEPVSNANFKSEFKEIVSLSHSIYSWVLQPFEKTIKNKRLVIIPNDELSYIPFETLITDTSGINDGNLNYGTLNYLLRTNPVSTLYTGQQLNKSKGKIHSTSKFAGFAPSYTDSSDKYEVLDGASAEVKSISDYFNGELYIGKDANKEVFLKKVPDYPIVHLAMHTALNKEDPLYSQLLFNNEENESVSPFHVHELLGHRFNTKLLILSGCNSGYGELYPGEGIINLARTFFYSGIDNIIVTQWEVPDKSSSVIMSNFYKYLSKGHPVDAALQRSKINYLETADPMRLHPYYWSGYSVVGDPLISTKKINLFYKILVLAGILIILLLLYIKKAGK